MFVGFNGPVDYFHDFLLERLKVLLLHFPDLVEFFVHFNYKGTFGGFVRLAVITVV